MKAPIRFLLLLISLISIAAMACGGSGGSASGGIGGSGFQARSVGSVSNLGSIFVNGVEFETNTASITDDDDQPFPEGDLAIGMVVEVDGQINTNGISGTADQVTVITAVQGPVDAVAGANSITVMGQPVAIDDQTIIDDSIINLGGITNMLIGTDVEVHGTVDPNRTIRATRIEDKTGTLIYKVRGFTGNLMGNTFQINGLTINFATANPNDFGPGGPPADSFVSVKGARSGLIAGVLAADSVEDEARALGENANAEIEGFISSIVNANTFTLVTGAGTFQFAIDATTEFNGGDVGDLVVGLEVEVEGAFSGGILIADEVEVKDGIRLENSVDPSTLDAADLTIEPSSMSALVLKLNDQTEIDDNRSNPPPNPTLPQLLTSLNGNETLRLRARVSSRVIPNQTELVVTDLRISDDPPAIIDLRGPLDTPPDQDGNLRILGVAVTSSEPLTTFFDIDDIEIPSRSVFLNLVNTGTLVDAEGTMTTDNEMDATQLSIED